MTEIYGPQPKGDNKFTARMRFHQSWYRAKTLGVPFGCGPQENSTTQYGNMLEKAGADRGLNFLNQEIFEAARERADQDIGTVDKYRLYHNMLSSQPMCFNLVVPLGRNRQLAKQVFSELISTKIQSVDKVLVEYAPTPEAEYLNDRTAFDAFIEYTDTDDMLGFIGIETKLTEPFSPKKQESEEYLKWTKLPDSPWSENSWPKLPEIRINQLWRDHLMAIAMLKHKSTKYANSYLMSVRHSQDHHCSETVEIYRGLLKSNDKTFVDCPLDKLTALIEGLVGAGAEREWIEKFRQRYLDLSLSEDAWQKSKKKKP